jgi:hypothetical protein
MDHGVGKKDLKVVSYLEIIPILLYLSPNVFALEIAIDVIPMFDSNGNTPDNKGAVMGVPG